MGWLANPPMREGEPGIGDRQEGGFVFQVSEIVREVVGLDSQ